MIEFNFDFREKKSEDAILNFKWEVDKFSALIRTRQYPMKIFWCDIGGKENI